MEISSLADPQQRSVSQQQSNNNWWKKKKGRCYRRRGCPVKIFEVFSIGWINQPFGAVDSHTIKLPKSKFCIVRMLKLYKSVGPESESAADR
jgi:hypothetical protein